jgi:AcrR family transcriptional regulator
MPFPAPKAAILETAGALFAAHGPQGVSMRQIAQSCGVHLPSIYHVYENKQTLYDACREAAHRRGADAITAAMGESGPLDADRLDAFARAVCAGFETDRDLRAYLLQDEWRGVEWLTGTAPLVAPFEDATLIAARLRNVAVGAARDALGVFALLGLARGMASRGAVPLPAPEEMLDMAFASPTSGSAAHARSRPRA